MICDGLRPRLDMYHVPFSLRIENNEARFWWPMIGRVGPTPRDHDYSAKFRILFIFLTKGSLLYTMSSNCDII